MQSEMHAGVILTCLLLGHVFAHLVTTETRLDTRRSLVFLVLHLKIGAKYQLCEFSFILNYSKNKHHFRISKITNAQNSNESVSMDFSAKKIKH